MKTELKSIQEVLKQQLKLSKFTYETIGNKLGVSRATIKRLLNGDDISLSKLIDISECLNISIYDLIESARPNDLSSYQFSLEQELILAKTFQHFKVFREALLTPDSQSISTSLSIPMKELVPILAELEKVQLIESWPNHEIKTLANFPFKWIDGGPLQKKYSQIVQKKISSYLKHNSFNKEDSSCYVKELLLSEEHIYDYEEELKQLMQKYSHISQSHLKYNSGHNKVVSTLHFVDQSSWWE